MKHKDLEVFFHELNERVLRLSRRVTDLERALECAARGTHAWTHMAASSDGHVFQCQCCKVQKSFLHNADVPPDFQRLIDAKYVFDVFPK